MNMPCKPKIAVIILNWNSKEDTLACLRSVYAIDYPNQMAIVVDNGSIDGSIQAILSEFPSIPLLQNGGNLGFAEGNNVGIRYALEKGADWILLLNNDTVVDPHLLTAFTEAFHKYPDTGIFGAKIYLYDKRDTLDHWGGMWNPKKGQFDLIGLRQKEEFPQKETCQPIDYVCGAALIARRDVWETAGLLEPRFFLIWEESDLCFRARRKGFITMTCPQAHIYHKVSASFSSKAHSTYFWWRNRLLWIEKNCPKREKWYLYPLVLLPEIAHLIKIYLLKTIQIDLRSWLNPHGNFESQREKLFKNRAALQGIFDYALRRFGNAPAWVFSKTIKR